MPGDTETSNSSAWTVEEFNSANWTKEDILGQLWANYTRYVVERAQLVS